MLVGNLIIKAGCQTSRFDSRVVSVYCNDPGPSVVEDDIWGRVLKLQMSRPWRP